MMCGYAFSAMRMGTSSRNGNADAATTGAPARRSQPVRGSSPAFREVAAELDNTYRSCYRMFMPKKALSVTLAEQNLLWLKGRAAGRKSRSLSDALDDILTEARQGGRGASPARSVAGTVDIAHDDPMLEHADGYVLSLFDRSLGRATPSRRPRRG